MDFINYHNTTSKLIMHTNRTEDYSSRNKTLILINVILTSFMTTLDSSIVNVALPVISRKLSVSTEAVSWIVTSYLIAIVSTILIFGRLGDIKGKTKIFKYGILQFTIASLLCGLANSLNFLVFARMIQGISAAAALAPSMGIVTEAFPDKGRGRALGLVGTFTALGSMAGPPIGGFIVSTLSWNYIFLINIPIGLLIYLIGIRVLPKNINKIPEKLDIKGALIFGISIILLFGSLIFKDKIGKSGIITGILISLILFIIFIHVEKKLKEPLLKLDIFKNSLYSLSIFCAFISFFSISCTFIVHPFYLQNTMKYTPAFAGIIMMTFPVVLSIFAPISGHISDKFGSEFITLFGLLFTSIGLFLLSSLNENSTLIFIVGFMAVMSLGNGLFQSPNNSLVMSLVPRDKLGIAGSINTLIRSLGLVVGVSFSTILLYNRMSSKIGYQVNSYILGRDDLFVYGMKAVYITGGIICAAGALLTVYRLWGAQRKTIADR